MPHHPRRRGLLVRSDAERDSTSAATASLFEALAPVAALIVLVALSFFLFGTACLLASGYVSTSGHVAIDAIASRGGMESMLPTIWLVISAFAFGGIVEKTGVLEKIVASIAGLARTTAASWRASLQRSLRAIS